jgi:hypothetical protein
VCMMMRHSRSLPSRNGELVSYRKEHSSEMTNDRKGPPILIRHRWLPTSFENVLFFPAKHSADISGSRKRHVSKLFTRNSVSKSFIFNRLHTNSRPNRTWKPQELPCHINFLKYSRIGKQRALWISWPRTSRAYFSSLTLLCLSRFQRWGTRNIHDKNWHRKVHDFDHLVYFWNPPSTCIAQRYDIQVSVLLSTCYSGYPAKHLLFEPQQNFEGDSILLHLDNAPAHNSRLSSEMIKSVKAQRVPYPRYRSDRAPSDFFLFGCLKENPVGHLSLPVTISSLRDGKFSRKSRK